MIYSLFHKYISFFEKIQNCYVQIYIILPGGTITENRDFFRKKTKHRIAAHSERQSDVLFQRLINS